MNIQAIRRSKLAQLIRDRFGGSQAKFVEITGENQGEVSALLRDKSFGEKKARKIEGKCGLASGWLDTPDDKSATGRYAADTTVGRWIPVVGFVQGKPDGEVIIAPCPPDEEGWAVYSLSPDSSAYALQMRGDGMRPRVKHAEYLIVEPDALSQPGDDVLVTRADGSQIIKELLWMRDGETYLGSINHGCPPITLMSSEIDRMHRLAAIVSRGSSLLRKS